jgi:hypothetical protein
MKWVILLIVIFVYIIFVTRNDPRIEHLKERYYTFLGKLPEKYSALRSPSILTGTYEPSDIGTNVSKGGEIFVCLDGHDPNDTFHILLHELAHSGVTEYDHSNSFWNTYNDLRKIAIQEGFYTPFTAKPYCGKSITDSS